MPWRAVITRPVPRPATAGPAPPAAHLLFPPGREHQHPGGEPAGPSSLRRRSHRCCSARTRSGSWCQPVTGSPRWRACRSQTWLRNRCCSPRKCALRNSISSPSRCAGRPASPPPCTGGPWRASGRPPISSPRDGVCTACPPPASPRSPGPPGGRSPNRRPTTHGRSCGARPTTPATYAPSSAARRRCQSGSAGCHHGPALPITPGATAWTFPAPGEVCVPADPTAADHGALTAAGGDRHGAAPNGEYLLTIDGETQLVAYLENSTRWPPRVSPIRIAVEGLV